MTEIENFKSYMNGMITSAGCIYATYILLESIFGSASLTVTILSIIVASTFVFLAFYYVNYQTNYESKELKLYG